MVNKDDYSLGIYSLCEQNNSTTLDFMCDIQA